MRPLQINQNLNYEKIYLFHFDITNIMIVFFMCKYFLCFFNIVSETIFLYTPLIHTTSSLLITTAKKIVLKSH